MKTQTESESEITKKKQERPKKKIVDYLPYLLPLVLFGVFGIAYLIVLLFHL